MFESESLLRHETIGQRLETCDICGQPAAELSTIVIDGDRAGTEPVEEMRVCPGCRERLYRDELSVDDELTPNIEPNDD
ncbi:MAG TPA: hypothetical protein VFI12_03035 [Thermomicrobiales bacterium]|jgi:hypothetical protein|nr:hypothetical protein [Thermomicrobiales bacterium]